MTSEAAARRRAYNRAYMKAFYAAHPCYHAWERIRVCCGLVRGANANIRRSYLPKRLRMEPAWAADYAAFEHWCLAHGWRKGLWVGRLDTDAGFTADNCVVCTRREQMGRRKGLPEGLRRAYREGRRGLTPRDAGGRFRKNEEWRMAGGTMSKRTKDVEARTGRLFGGEAPGDFAALVREAQDIAGALGAELDAGHVAVLAALWWRLGPLDRTRPPLAAGRRSEK